MWIDIVSLVFVCVTMNHLGLIKAIEDKIGYELPVLDCVKCSTFWCVLVYTTILSHHFIAPLAISFLASYMAIWLELLEGFIDALYTKLYTKLYAKIYSNPDKDTSSSDNY